MPQAPSKLCDDKFATPFEIIPPLPEWREGMGREADDETQTLAQLRGHYDLPYRNHHHGSQHKAVPKIDRNQSELNETTERTSCPGDIWE